MTSDRSTCDLGPTGWWCSRAAGHEGPCALRERAVSGPNLLVRRWVERLLTHPELLDALSGRDVALQVLALTDPDSTEATQYPRRRIRRRR